MSIANEVESFINGSPKYIFLADDFSHIGNYTNRLTSLKFLVDNGRLIRVSNGVFAKVHISSITGKPAISHPQGAFGAMMDILNLLGIKFTLDSLSLSYFEGKSSQIPANPKFTLLSKCTRKFSIGGIKINC